MWSGIFGLRSDDAVGAALLEGVRDPSAHAADRERRCEQFNLESEPVQQERGVELDIRLQPSSGFVLFEQAKRVRLNRSGEGVQRHVAMAREQPLRRPGQHVGSWIANLVDAMSEPHQLFAGLDLPA